MSTESILVQLEADGRLKRFAPRFVGGEREMRRISLLPAHYDWLHKSTSPGENEYRSKVRTHFAQFVKGNEVDDCRFMKRIEDRRFDPPTFAHETWAISPRFGTQHRFFGLFALTDWFLVLAIQSRDRLAANNSQWHIQIDKVDRTWNALFPGMRKFTGTLFAHYVKHNGVHCDTRW